MKIRPALPSDTPTLVRLTDETGVFKPLEIQALHEVLDDFHASNHTFGHRAFVAEVAGEIVGYVYHAPAAMTDRTWYLYWIAVRKDRQQQGFGAQLLQFVEADIRAANGRLLLIETSSTPLYEATRRFYHKHGYEWAAQLRDFYSDGDDMIVFRKRL